MMYFIRVLKILEILGAFPLFSHCLKTASAQQSTIYCELSNDYKIISPGAGKSSISDAAIRLLNINNNHDTNGEDDGDGKTNNCREGRVTNTVNGVLDGYRYLYLDLDVCVPQWMRVSHNTCWFDLLHYFVSCKKIQIHISIVCCLFCKPFICFLAVSGVSRTILPKEFIQHCNKGLILSIMHAIM